MTRLNMITMREMKRGVRIDTLADKLPAELVGDGEVIAVILSVGAYNKLVKGEISLKDKLGKKEEIGKKLEEVGRWSS